MLDNNFSAIPRARTSLFSAKKRVPEEESSSMRDASGDAFMAPSTPSSIKITESWFEQIARQLFNVESWKGDLLTVCRMAIFKN